MLNIIGRNKNLFTVDIKNKDKDLQSIVSKSKFLILGGAGSIGQSVVKEIFKRSPKKLHVVDISENNLVELVRDLRSSYGYIDGEFKTFALDIGSLEYDSFFESDGLYDYVFNLSALKHVRSEKDPYTLMRMIKVNILNTNKTIEQSINKNVKKYFCVSTDKAANPVNMMGASKKIMELYINRYSNQISISMARFANVAFSDGSLLHGFNKRIEKKQPIVAPNDVKRYFITNRESGELCLLSCIYGKNRDIFFPKLNNNFKLQKFSDIAVKYLSSISLKVHICKDENEARSFLKDNSDKSHWPCLFTKSDTTGEKDYEEFFTNDEELDLDTYQSIGVIKNKINPSNKHLKTFEQKIKAMRFELNWTKKEILDLFLILLPQFKHEDKGKYLDEKM